MPCARPKHLAYSFLQYWLRPVNSLFSLSARPASGVTSRCPSGPPSGQGNRGVRRLPFGRGVGSDIVNCTSVSRDGAVHAALRFSWTGVKPIILRWIYTRASTIPLALAICNPRSWFARPDRAEVTRCTV